MARSPLTVVHSASSDYEEESRAQVKGLTSTQGAISMDITSLCIPDECPLSTQCIYVIDTSGTKPCKLQEIYLQTVAKKLSKATKKGSEIDMLRVGMLMMPMFTQLVQYQIHSSGVGAVLPGNRANPLLKESREIIKILDSMLSKLGGDGRKIGGDGSNKDNAGESGFYDSLFDEAQAPARKPKGKRRTVMQDPDDYIEEE